MKPVNHYNLFYSSEKIKKKMFFMLSEWMHNLKRLIVVWTDIVLIFKPRLSH